MMALALNLLALIIVLGLCWGAMMWLSGRFHGHSARDAYYERAEYYHGDISPDGVYERPAGNPNQEPCTVCEGVGAQNRQGKLAPCPECYGTGVVGTPR